MVPEGETRIDLEQVEAAVGPAFEVELGDTAQLEPANDLAAQERHVWRIGDDQGRAVAVGGRPCADLASGEFGHHGAAIVDVHMVAFNPCLRTRDQLLKQHRDAGDCQARPQRDERHRRLDSQRLGPSGNRVPSLAAAHPRLERHRVPEVEGHRVGARVERPRRRHGQVEPLRQDLKPAFVDEGFHQCGVWHDEAEVALEALAVARDEQQVTILRVEQHRGLRLRGPEALEQPQEQGRLLPRIGPIQHHPGEARVARRHPRCRRNCAADTSEAERAEQVDIAQHARERPLGARRGARVHTAQRRGFAHTGPERSGTRIPPATPPGSSSCTSEDTSEYE